jgi:DNA-binding transcriptional MocR family regulator
LKGIQSRARSVRKAPLRDNPEESRWLPLGYRPLREFIARKLADDAGIACSPDEILITSGSLQGLDLVNHVLLSPGDTVIVEQMTYGGAGQTRLRLCFAHPPEQVIREGIARLAEVCHREFAVPARGAKGHR